MLPLIFTVARRENLAPERLLCHGSAMPSPHSERRPIAVVPCGTGCVYAEIVPALGPDWIWCRQPDAAIRLVRADRECTSFAAVCDGLPPAGAADQPDRAV